MRSSICARLADQVVDYNKDVEGRVFDRIIDMVFEPLQSYITNNRKISDNHGAKLLWIYLCMWGNVLAVCECPNFWIKNIGRRVVRTLKEHESLLGEIGNAKAEPKKVYLQLAMHENELKELFIKLTDIETIGLVAAAKVIYLVTKGRIPLLDSSIAKCIIGDLIGKDPNKYIEGIKALLKLAHICLGDSYFQEVLRKRNEMLSKNEYWQVSEPRRTVFKALDEGLWRYLVKGRRNIEKDPLCTESKRIIAHYHFKPL